MKLLRRILTKVGVDGTIVYTVSARAIQACGGLGVLFLISKYLSKTEQGYYYTFGSILAIQIFFELGLNGIISQYVAHESADLLLGSDFELSGDPEKISRLSSLLRFCIKWFGAISVIFFIGLLISGNIFFNRYNQNSHVNWQWPWFFLALGSSLMMFIDPLLGILEGLGKIKEVARLRLIQQTIAILVVATTLLSGGKLYAGAGVVGCLLIVTTLYILFSPFGRILLNIWKGKGEWVVNYTKEILPYQWRIALSWISGYFIFQLFNPVLFATEGAAMAGKMGMTLTAFNGITSLSMSWISTKVPVFSKLIAKRDFFSLDRLFDMAFKQTQLVNGAGVCIFILGLIFLRWRGFELADRFLPLYAVLLLALTTFVNQMIYSWATYLRCHKAEPFLAQSIGVGILSAASTLCLGIFLGLKGIVGGYTFIVVFVSMIWGYMIFKTKKAQWHY